MLARSGGAAHTRSTAGAIGVQGGRCAHGREEAIEVEAVILFGVAALIVIAVVIAAIGRPGDGPGRGGREIVETGAHRRAGYSSSAAVYAWTGSSSSGCGDSSGGGGASCGGGSF